MATKTWKLGEIARGGIITAEVKGSKVTIIGKDWDMSAGTKRGSCQKNAEEWTRVEIDVVSSFSFSQLYDFLTDLTSSYYANKIIEWVETKLNTKISRW